MAGQWGVGGNLYDDRNGFLKNLGFSRQDTTDIIAAVLHEEGHPPESIFDFVQGITALARGKGHQDGRVELEQRAKRLMEKVG